MISGMAIAQKKETQQPKEQAQQKELPQPFQGGNEAYNQFFKDSLQVTGDIIKAKASGTAIFKFTADAKGNISKIVVYYADDYLIAQPAIEALKKTNGKWVIPDKMKFYDFVIPFTINFIPSNANRLLTQKAMYTFYTTRKPIVATNQVPLNQATLLPTVVVNYEQ
ncbi:hypothetical protein BEL04_19625 [Mucilaginibacter sp. PPCGB 2223]|nr:hypothetical protein BEL04_19625 [Mucilaginibacter sp. PPCGB 2223]